MQYQCAGCGYGKRCEECTSDDDLHNNTSVVQHKYGTCDAHSFHRKLRTKQFFGFKVAALNVSKLIRHLQGKLKCKAFETA